MLVHGNTPTRRKIRKKRKKKKHKEDTFPRHRLPLKTEECEEEEECETKEDTDLRGRDVIPTRREASREPKTAGLWEGSGWHGNQSAPSALLARGR